MHPWLRDTLIEGFSHLVTSMTAPIASAGAVARWDLHPLESAVFARRTPQADIPVSSSEMLALADDSCICAKNDVPKTRRHAVITILEAMMREVPHLC
jgi:hypothetical protein